MTISRSIPAAVRAELEKSGSVDALLAFITITHPALTDDIRVVGDALDYMRGGKLFTGVVFGFKILSDSDSPPYTELEVLNIDRRISRAIRNSTERASVSLEILTSADFDQTQEPRVEFGTAATVYGFVNYELFDVAADVISLRGRVMLRDYAQEPWPSISTVQSKLPGLFRA